MIRGFSIVKSTMLRTFLMLILNLCFTYQSPLLLPAHPNLGLVVGEGKTKLYRHSLSVTPFPIICHSVCPFVCLSACLSVLLLKPLSR